MRPPDLPQRPESPSDVEGLLAAARTGSDEALGQLLETCRPYLLSIANDELDPQLRGKLGGSDLVQDTFLRAQASFHQFHGKTREEWLSWLRTIILHHLANVQRAYRGTGKRALQRELPLASDLHNGADFADESPSPSSLARHHERDDKLRAALARLPELQRQLIAWRNYEMQSFDEIGRRLGKSAEAARKLWVRALEQLETLLDSPE